MAALGGVSAYSTAAADRLVLLVLSVGAAGCAIVSIALAARVALLIPWGAAFVGAAYALSLSLHRGSVDAKAVYVAAAMIVACELAFLSVRTTAGGVDRRVGVDVAASLCAVVFVTLVAGEVVLLASGQTNSGLALEAIGAACAIVAVATTVRIAATRSRDSTSS